MTIPSDPGKSSLPLSLLGRVDQAGDRFEDAWEAGQRPPIEEFLADSPEPERSVLLHELLLLEVGYRRQSGETPTPAEYRQRFPDHTALIQNAFGEAHTPAHRADRPPADPLDTPREPAPPPSTAAAPRPTVPGYEILDELGHGGMGVVYRARDTRLGRLVALKMLRTGAQASPEELARFRTEAALQAHVQHPHLVQIFEIGETAEGPFFALELVEGPSLNKVLAGTPQPAAAAARLVETLARAVHHAHQKGLVHRDLKPANILLKPKSEVPNPKSQIEGVQVSDFEPKVGDFGLARRLEGDAGKTESGTVVGTPHYMAPEQAWGRLEAIGPATDVYALGAILYALLIGRPPLVGANALDTVLQVRHQEPVPPRRLVGSVPRDLETICLKCLHKEPARRYATAEGLAEDLRRYRAGEPIVARPVGIAERGLKWARRRPTAAALAGVLLAALAGGTAGGLWYAERERDRANQEAGRERERANQESALRHQAEQSEADAQAVLGFFQDQVLAAARPQNQDGGLGINTTIRDALHAAEPKIAGAFQDRPLVEASIRTTLGLTFQYLREGKAAIAQHERALELRREHLGPDHLDTLASMNNLGTACQFAGQLPRAASLLEQTLAQRRAKLGPDHFDTLASMNNLADVYRALGQYAKGLGLLEQTVPKMKEQLGPDHPRTLSTMNNLALAYQNTSQLHKALPLYQLTLAKRKEHLGADHPDTLTTMNNLATAYQNGGQLAEALALYEETLAKRRERLGPEHSDTLDTANNLALAYQAAGQFAKAVRMLEETLATKQKHLGPEHPGTLLGMINLAGAYQTTGQLPKAVPLYEKALSICEAKYGPHYPGTLVTMNNLARAYQAAGQRDKALKLFEDSLARHEAAFGPDHRNTLTCMNNLALAYHEFGQRDKALSLFEKALAKRTEQLGRDDPDTLASMGNLAAAYERQGRFAEAEPLLRDCLTLRQQKFADAWLTFATQSQLGGCLLAQMNYAEAEPLLRDGYEGLKEREAKIPANAKKSLAEALERLVQLYDAWGKPEQADEWRKQLDQVKPPTK